MYHIKTIKTSAHIKTYIYFSLSVPVVLKRTHPQNKQNRSSTLGPLHLNPMDILRSVFTSRISSRILLTAVWILFFNPLIYRQNLALLKDGLVQHVSPSLTTKGGAFVY